MLYMIYNIYHITEHTHYNGFNKPRIVKIYHAFNKLRMVKICEHNYYKIDPQNVLTCCIVCNNLCGNTCKHVATELSVDIKLSVNHIVDEYTKFCLILMTQALMYFKCQIDHVLLMSHVTWSN